MAKEEIIVDLRIEKDESGGKINELTSSIIALTKANKELIEQNKLMEAAGQENSKQYVENTKQLEINKQKISENSASRKGLIQSIAAEDNSIKQLKIRNAELIKQRDQISTSTSEGRKKIRELNKEIDTNSETIKDNSSELERQKANIGNYKSALDAVVPGLSGMTEGIYGALKASLAFIATPIGAIIAALGVALLAVKSYLTGTEAGMDKLAEISAVLGAALDVLISRFKLVGSALVAFATGDFEKGVTDLTASYKDLGDEMQREAGIALELARRMDILDELNLSLKVRTSEQANEIQNLIIQSKNRMLTEEERIAKLQEAAEIEKKLTGEAIALKVAALNAASEDLQRQNSEHAEAQKQGETTIEFTKRLIANQDILFSSREELQKQLAEYNQLQAEQANIQEKIANQEDQLKLKIEAEAEALRQLNAEVDAYMKKVLEKMNFDKGADGEAVARKDTAFEKEKARNQERIDMGQDFIAQETKIMDERTVSWDALAKANHDVAIQQSKDRKKGTEEAEKRAMAEAQGYADVAAAASAAMGQQTAAGKAFALAQIAINSGIAVAQAVKSGSNEPWPINLLAIISGIASVMAGIAQAKAIMKFAKGGFVAAYANGGRTSPLSGTRIMNNHGTPIKRSNGDNRLATVKTGEVILNEQQQSALGGPATFRAIGVPGFATGGTIQSSQIRTAARQAESTLDMQQLAGLINTVVPVLVLEDFEAKQSTVNAIEQRAQVI
jgi:hypothetical protein